MQQKFLVQYKIDLGREGRERNGKYEYGWKEG